MRLRVRLQFPDVRPEDVGAPVRVEVRDTSMADALHPAVANVVQDLADEGGEMEVEIEVPDGALQERHRYSLFAHVDHGGTGAMESGDMIITESVPVTADAEGEEPIVARLTRI